MFHSTGACRSVLPPVLCWYLRHPRRFFYIYIESSPVWTVEIMRFPSFSSRFICRSQPIVTKMRSYWGLSYGGCLLKVPWRLHRDSKLWLSRVWSSWDGGWEFESQSPKASRGKGVICYQVPGMWYVDVVCCLLIFLFSCLARSWNFPLITNYRS